MSSLQTHTKNEMSQRFFLLVVVCGVTQDALQIKKIMIELFISTSQNYEAGT